MKAQITNIPIVFETGGDPVQLGLVARLDQWGGNLMDATQLSLRAVVASGGRARGDGIEHDC